MSYVRLVQSKINWILLLLMHCLEEKEPWKESDREGTMNVRKPALNKHGALLFWFYSITNIIGKNVLQIALNILKGIYWIQAKLEDYLSEAGARGFDIRIGIMVLDSGCLPGYRPSSVPQHMGFRGPHPPALASGFRTYQTPKMDKLLHSPNIPCPYK